MGTAEWGAHPEFFGPRHAHREARIVRLVERCVDRPGRHLECAAGVGSLSAELTRRGHAVVAVDRSLRSLAHLRGLPVLAVVAAIERLPFADRAFVSATSAETLEHVADDRAAARELGRVLEDGGWLVGTVPTDPGQWSEWDDWSGHLRRYRPQELAEVLREVGPEPRVTVWGWPLLRLYDGLFMGRINRRRFRSELPLEQDPALRRVAALGRRRWLVRAVAAAFDLDRPFDGLPWGVGLLFAVARGRGTAA